MTFPGLLFIKFETYGILETTFPGLLFIKLETHGVLETTLINLRRQHRTFVGLLYIYLPLLTQDYFEINISGHLKPESRRREPEVITVSRMRVPSSKMSLGPFLSFTSRCFLLLPTWVHSSKDSRFNDRISSVSCEDFSPSSPGRSFNFQYSTRDVLNGFLLDYFRNSRGQTEIGNEGWMKRRIRSNDSNQLLVSHTKI